MKLQYIYVTYYHGTTPTDHLHVDLLTEFHLYRIVTKKTVKLSSRLMDTAAATLWNDLPDNIRNCDNTWTFKKLLEDLSILTITCYLIAFTVHIHIMLLYTVRIVHHSVYTSIIPYL